MMKIMVDSKNIMCSALISMPGPGNCEGRSIWKLLNAVKKYVFL